MFGAGSTIAPRMDVPEGSFTIGPEDSRLVVRTRRRGLGAMAGHDLTIEATRWQGTVEVAEWRLERVELTVDARSFAVREGSGGAKPLTDKDRAEIKANIESKVLDASTHPQIRFWSMEAGDVSREPARVTATVVGDLELVGRARPLSVHVEAETSETGGLRAHATATIRQSEWGITPYTAFLGALKVADEVQVDIVAELRS